MNQSTLTTVRRTLLPFLTGLLCGCVAEPRLEPPPRCSTRFPATTAVWTFAREQTKAQAVACFDWSGAETTSAQAAQGALRVTLVCPLVPVTPLIDAYFAIGMTPFLAPLDLMVTRECGKTEEAGGKETAGAADYRSPRDEPAKTGTLRENGDPR